MQSKKALILLFGIIYIFCGVISIELPIRQKIRSSGRSVSETIGLLNVSMDPNDVGFYLYPNPNDVEDDDVLIYSNRKSIVNSRYNSSNPVILMIHGFTQSYKSQFPYYLKRAYLKAGYATKANIIAVDWGKLSGTYNDSAILGGFVALPPSYKLARANVNVVGKRVQEFLCYLIKYNFLSGPDKIHIVGQSMGAHISGMAGYYFHKATKTKIARITGTDPASPLFQAYPKSKRLDETDAKFVEIVHTSQGLLGYIGPLGHVDFFINGGGPIPMPPCFSNLTDLFCSHNLAPRYYAKTVDNNVNIKGRGITFTGLMVSFGSQVFGEFCPPSARGIYSVKLDL